MQSPNILLINPSKDFYKKGIDQALKVNQLNFGILAIASRFPSNVFIYDCQGKEYGSIISELLSIIRHKKISIVGISLISAYSKKSAFSIADALHNHIEDISIIYGGQDHAPYIAETLIDFHYAKAVVKYDGESFFKNIIHDGVDIHDCPSIIYKNDAGQLIETHEEKLQSSLYSYDHALYPDYQRFVPSIEVSRGCNNSCVFCSNNRKRQAQKSVDEIIEEINAIKSAYGENICAYFQTPHFLLPKNDLKKIAKYRAGSNSFIWRTQTSVRYLTIENIQLLYNAGARVIDVGFESASPEMLSHMGKDKSPNEYLAIMKRALKAAAEIGLRLKLNILLFAGETHASLTQTALFLKDNLHGFHSFSAYPVMVYPSHNSDKFIEKINELGGSIVEVPTSRSIYHVNLSSQIDYQKANRIALLLGKSFQNVKMYMSQRHIGYLPTCHSIKSTELVSELSPFYLSADEQRQAQSELLNIIEGLA